MSSTIAAIVGVVLAKKKEDPLAPFKRSYKLAHENEQAAIIELQCATEDLMCAVREAEEGK